MEPCDMLVNLTHLPEIPSVEGVKIKAALACNKAQIMEFIRERWGDGWCGEAEKALLQQTPKLFIATEKGNIIGFACFDSTARDYFGPIGVDESCRGRKIGEALLLRTLHAMRDYGYGYAIIGDVGDAHGFYEKIAGASFIPGGTMENTVYSNLASM